MINKQKKINTNVNHKINNSSPQKLTTKNFLNKKEKLFGLKSFLEIILGLIKNAQNTIIINKENKNNIFQPRNLD